MFSPLGSSGGLRVGCRTRRAIKRTKPLQTGTKRCEHLLPPTPPPLKERFQTNVLGPILLGLLVYPKLLETKSKFSITPRLVFIGSDTHYMAWTGAVARMVDEDEDILRGFNTESEYNPETRYPLSKVKPSRDESRLRQQLLLQMGMRNLIPRLPDVIVLCSNPGKRVRCWSSPPPSVV